VVYNDIYNNNDVCRHPSHCLKWLFFARWLIIRDMSASRVVELYRFNEHNNTYDGFTVLVYYHDECVVMGMIEFNLSMRQELFAHLRQCGVKWLRYTHKTRKKIICLGGC
jgi:hypothetical protein